MAVSLIIMRTAQYEVCKLQSKRLLWNILYCRKSVTFWNEDTFTLTSFVQEVHIILKWNNLQSLDKALFYL